MWILDQPVIIVHDLPCTSCHCVMTPIPQMLLYTLHDAFTAVIMLIMLCTLKIISLICHRYCALLGFPTLFESFGIHISLMPENFSKQQHCVEIFGQNDSQLDYYSERLATCSSDGRIRIFKVFLIRLLVDVSCPLHINAILSPM